MTYDIRQHSNVLTPAKGSKTKYHCPLCNGHNLDIKQSTGAYTCFSNGCNPKEIRAAIDKLEGKPDWKPEQDNWVKPIRPKSEQEYFYPARDGKPLVMVKRIDHGDGSKKIFPQSHWDGGKWVSGNPDEVKKLIPIYRHAEVIEAIGEGKLIFIPEGEAAADALWQLGIPATTTIGGAGKFSAYGDYAEDLESGQFVLVPDRDPVGVKHMEEVAKFLGERVNGYYLAGTQGLWRNPQGGMDIGDDIQDHSYSKEQILGRIITPDKYRELTTKSEATSAGELDAKDLADSLEMKNSKAPMVFGGELGKLLSIAAANFNIPTEVLTFCLLPILASQIDSRTELLINPGTDYRVPAVRWCGLVGDTGSKKSPVLGLLTKALSGQQNELYEVYKANKLAYDAEFRAWKAKPPKSRDEEPEIPAPLRDLYFSDFTIEGLVSSLGNYPDSGYLLSLDELASFFSAMDAYRGGKGGDRQKWLTIWNGGGIKVNRKSTDTICVPQSSISIVGGIQPQTISNLIGRDNSQQDGLWNRFAFMGLPHNTTEAFSETPGDLKEELDKIYRALSNQATQTHCLAIESKPLWKVWHDEIEAKTISESNWLIKGTYAKFEGIAGRNALIIHRTLAAIAGTEPEQLISPKTLELAIAWTQFELNQTLSQYQLLAIDGTNPEQVRILKFIDKFAGKGWINARSVTHWWSGRVKPPTNEVRKFMSGIVSLGYAKDNGKPKDSSDYQIQISESGSNSSNKASTNVTQQQKILLLPLVTTLVTDNPELIDRRQSEVVTTDCDDGSNRAEPLVNSVLADEVVTTVTTDPDSVTNGSNRVKTVQSNKYSHPVTTVTTIPDHKKLTVGDLVKNLETGEIGILSKWWQDRSKATIESEEGISDWIPVNNLELVEVE